MRSATQRPTPVTARGLRQDPEAAHCCRNTVIGAHLTPEGVVQSSRGPSEDVG